MAGFTLTELLVCVAIIVILTAILFPAIAQARQKAGQAVCAGNLRQLVLALHMYSEDYDGVLPCATFSYGTPPPGYYTWRLAVLPYVRDLKLFFCPGARVGTPFDGTLPDGAQDAGYGMNFTHCAPGPPDPPPGMPLATIAYPSETVLLSDCHRPSFAITLDNAHGSGQLPVGGPPHRHSGGAMYGFCDGHVKWFHVTQIKCDGRTGECWYDSD